MNTAPLPTVVLIHGAFADASGWQAVADDLRGRGYPVLAPANPLRGVAADADYVRDVVSTIEGDVVLVGHSYGGCVITNVGTGNPRVRALVYIAAFAPDEGETLLETFELGGGSTELGDHLDRRPYPDAPEGDADGYIQLESFHRLFCADLSAELAGFMSVAQRGFALSCLSSPSGVPGWRTIPSWYLVAADDATIPPEAQRAMSKRAGAHTVEVSSSHVAMISKPAETVELIVAAAGG